jgi:hypothetical protein
MKYTCLFITVNTNVPVRYHVVGESERTDFARSVAYLCLHPTEVFEQDVLTCKPSALGVEIGSNQHRLHCHFLLTITTDDGFDITHVNQKLQYYYNSLDYGVFRLSRGCYVQAKLHDRSKTLNYAQKKGAQTLASRTFKY